MHKTIIHKLCYTSEMEMLLFSFIWGKNCTKTSPHLMIFSHCLLLQLINYLHWFLGLDGKSLGRRMQYNMAHSLCQKEDSLFRLIDGRIPSCCYLILKILNKKEMADYERNRKEKKWGQNVPYSIPFFFFLSSLYL